MISTRLTIFISFLCALPAHASSPDAASLEALCIQTRLAALVQTSGHFSDLEQRVGTVTLTPAQKLAALKAKERSLYSGSQALQILRDVKITPESQQEILENFILRNNPKLWAHTPERTGRLLNTFARSVEGVIARDQWMKWKPSDFVAARGKVLRYESASSRNRISQQVLLLEDLSIEERALSKKLLRASVNPKFVRRDKAFEESIKRGQLPVPEDQAVVNSLRPLVPHDSIESGAWRIELKSGKIITAENTSSRLRSMYSEDFVKALNAILSEHGVTSSDVKTLQFFHVHPVPGAPLSQGDEFVMLQIRDYFSVWGIHPAVDIYAITEVDGVPFIYQMGF